MDNVRNLLSFIGYGNTVNLDKQWQEDEKKRRQRNSGNVVKDAAGDTADFVKSIARSGLELGSTLIPAAKGLKFIASGAARGASQAAANTQTSNPLEFIKDVGEGAVGGIAGEGIIKGVGKGLSKLAQNTLNNAFREPTKKLTTAAIRIGKTLGDTVAGKTIKNLGKGNSESDIKKNALTELSSLEDSLQEKLKKSTATISITELDEKLMPLLNELKDVEGDASPMAKSITNRLDGWAARHGEEIPVAKANSIKRSLYDIVNKSYGTQAAPGTEHIKDIARALKDSISSKVDGVAEINNALSKHGRVVESMVDRMAKRKALNILDVGSMAPGVAAGIATGNPLLAAGSVAAPLILRALQSVGGEKAMAGLANTASKIIDNPITQRAAGVAGSMLVPGLIDAATDSTTGNAQANGPQDTQTDPNQSTHIDQSISQQSTDVNSTGTVKIKNKKTGEIKEVARDQLQQFGVQDPNDQQDPMQGLTADKLYKASQMAAMNGDIKSANQLGAMYARAAKYETSQSPKRGKLTGGQLKELSDIQNSISQMQTATDLVGSYTEKMGPFQGQIGSANKYDTDSQTFQSGMEAIAQQVGKAMEGGVLRAEDVPKYKKMLPQITDTPQVAKNKILQVQKLLNSQLSIKQQIYGDYDVAEGIDTTDPNSVNGMQFMQ